MSQIDVEDDSRYKRLETQIQWYDAKSAESKRWFKWMKTATIVISVAIPLFAAYASFAEYTGKFVALVTGALGSAIALLEAMQQLNQYHNNWIAYRSTAEALKHEKYLYMSLAGPYASAADPKSLLTERVESLVSQEHAKWASVQEQIPKTQGPRTKADGSRPGE